MIASLVPSGASLLGWLGVIFAVLVFVGLGRVLSRGSATPEIALVAGWGAACFVLTLWGVATPASLRFPAVILAAAGIIGLIAPGSRLKSLEWHGIWRVLVLALPLLLIMASARPSLPDTFLNLMPNAAYLYDHGSFPADDRWPSYSFLPGAPYNLQLAGFVASLIAPAFPANALIGFNVLLQLGFALFLARFVQRDETKLPSWWAVALGLLLTMALNPGFVPRYHLSGYSEPSVTVAVAFTAWLLVQMLMRFEREHKFGSELPLLAATLAGLIEIKQDSIALTLGLVASGLLIALICSRQFRFRSIEMIVAAALPAAVLYLAWRWYVLTHFVVGELKPLAVSRWQFQNLPLILGSMAEVVFEKPYFFLALLLAIILTVIRFRRGSRDQITRLGLMLIGLFILYNAALIFAYIAHFPGVMSKEAHSYFRYNTHLGLLLVLSLLLSLRDDAATWLGKIGGTAQRAMPALAIAVALLVPVLFFPFIRFDLERPQERAWELGRAAAEALGAEEHPRVALLLPGDNGSLLTMIEGILRYIEPRHRDVELKTISKLTPDTLQQLAAGHYDFAVLSCSAGGFAGVPPHQAAILERDRDQWRIWRSWTYPPVERGEHWSHVISESALCL